MYKCKQCDAACPTKIEFQEHFTQHLKPHQNLKAYKIDVDENSTVVHYCRLCRKNIDENDKRHYEKHIHQEERICDTCGKVYKCDKRWYRHLQMHRDVKNKNLYVCKICGKVITTRIQLKAHVRQVHSKERPFVCEICGKSFKFHRFLIRHRYIHTDDKPLSCEFCGKRYAKKDISNLKAHLRTHTGEKPYHCDICDAVFNHNVSLKTHKKSAHGIDMWKGIKPRGSQEVDNINVKDPELYKLRQKDVAAGLQRNSPQSKSTQKADSKDQPSKTSDTTGNFDKENTGH